MNAAAAHVNRAVGKVIETCFVIFGLQITDCII